MGRVAVWLRRAGAGSLALLAVASSVAGAPAVRAATRPAAGSPAARATSLAGGRPAAGSPAAGPGSLTVLVGAIGAAGTDPAAAGGPPGVLDDLYAPLLLAPGRADGPAYRWGPGALPELAASVTHHDGAYTITLRRNVRDCSGDTLTASDVVFALQRAERAAAVGHLASWTAWHAAGMAAPVLAPGSLPAAPAGTAEVLGPSELVLRPSPDDGMLPEMLALSATAPIDAKLVQHSAGPGDPDGLAWLSAHDAGFGPYCLSSYRAGRQVVLTANPYWRLDPRPSIHRVMIDAVASPATRLSELESGRAQVAEGLAPAQYAAAQQSSRARVLADDATTGHLQLDLDFNTPPWGPNGSARATLMRDAVAAALPYASIVAALDGGGATWQGELPPVIPGARRDAAIFSTNDVRAATDLAAAGHAGGRGLPVSGLVLSYDAGVPVQASVATILQSALAKVGIAISLEPVPAQQWSDVGAAEDPMALVTGGTTFTDAAWYSQRWYAAPAAGGELDLDGYDDPDLDVLVETAASASGATRAALVAREQSIELADLPVIPLALLVPRVVVSPSVRSMSVAGPGAFYAVTSLRR